MNIDIIKRGAGKFLSDNATTILTGVGVVGTVATAVLTAKATLKASEVLEQAKKDWDSASMKYDLEADGHGQFPPLTTTAKALAVWPYFIPPVIVGGATIASIVMANRMSAQRAAALAAAYGVSEGRLKEYRDKVAEKLTGPKATAITDEVAQDKVTANPPRGEVLILAEGDVLCYDMITGRYFRSNVETIRRAENEINSELYHHDYASLAKFQDLIGLPPTQFTEQVGWNRMVMDGAQLTVIFSTTLTPDGKPCVAIDFKTPPQTDYAKLY